MVTVLLNPAAGDAGNPRVQARLAELFLAANIHAEIVVLQPGQHPTNAARTIRDNVCTIVAAGGDGTVNGVASALVGSTKVLGVVPLGSLNHFAKDLHIPFDLEQAVATIAARHVAAVDVGLVNDRVFLNNASIGIYPSIVEAREQLRAQGHRKWPAFVLAVIQSLRGYRGVLVSIEVDGRVSVVRTPFVFVGNNEYTVEGLHLGCRAALDGGRLFAYLAPRMRTRDLPKLFATAVLRRSTLSWGFEIIPATELCIDTPGATRLRVALDGNVTTMTPPLRYRCGRGALNVLVPAA